MYSKERENRVFTGGEEREQGVFQVRGGGADGAMWGRQAEGCERTIAALEQKEPLRCSGQVREAIDPRHRTCRGDGQPDMWGLDLGL